MSFIEQPLSDYQEKEVAPEGMYDLIIEDAKVIPEQNRVSVRIAIQGGDYKPVWHNIWLIKTDDDHEKANNKLGMQTRFLDTFKIPYEGSGFSTDDFPGSTATCKVVQEVRVDRDGTTMVGPDGEAIIDNRLKV